VTSKELLRSARVSRNIFKYVQGIQGNRSLIRHEIWPSMSKGTCAEEKASKKCLAKFGRNCTAWDWEEEVLSLVLRKKLDYQPLLLKAFSYARSGFLVRNSSPHSL
jgi:hypothetical protein